MAGAGYKLFNTGDVLTAAQVNTYLQEQTVMVFANSTARTTALSGVLAEGMVSYLQDTNAVEVYNGSAWVNLGSSGDITAVNVTSPITGGGSSGDVTISIQDGTTAQKGAVQLEDSTSSTSTTKAATPNSVKSAYDLANAAIPKSLVDAAGDLIYATAADTVARLGIGTAGQVLKVNSGATAPEWGAASASSFVGVRIFRSTTQSVNNDTATEITFDSESWDTNSFHSTVSDTGRITIPSGQAGKYVFELGLQYDANATGVRQLNLYKNGSSIREFTNNTISAGVTAFTFTYIYDCAENDYFQFYTYQNSGGTRTLASGTDKTYFSAYKVG